MSEGKIFAIALFGLSFMSACGCVALYYALQCDAKSLLYVTVGGYVLMNCIKYIEGRVGKS